MANLLFKRGTHSDLMTKINGKSVTDGAFYLTTDTHRLYTGIGKELVDLNQYIRTVTSIDDANALTNVAVGDFVYISEKNILAVCIAVDSSTTKGTWKQVNPDTVVKNKSLTQVANSGTGTITTTVTDDHSQVSDTVKYVGKTGVTVTLSNTGDETNQEATVTIAGITYELGATLDSSNTTFTMTLDKSSGTKDTVTLKKGSNITFAKEENGADLVISATDTRLAAIGHTASANNAGVFTVSIKDTAGNTAIATSDADLYYTIGSGTEKFYNQAALPVYTKTEIDDQFRNLNGMSYKGVVASATELTSKESGAKSGDTYMVSAAWGSYRVGDLLIATGTEDASTGILNAVTWTHVPSGDDVEKDTTYYGDADASNHKLTIKDKANNSVAELDLNVSTENNKIELSSAAATLGTIDGKTCESLTTTIKHTGSAAIQTPETAAANALSITAVTAVSTDSTGHATEVKTKTYNIATPILSGATISAVKESEAANAKQIGIKVVDTLKDSAGNNRGTSEFELVSESNNITFTASGKRITTSLVWDTF